MIPSQWVTHMKKCWLVLEFNDPVNTVKVISSQLVYLTTLFLGKLRSLSSLPYLCTFFRQEQTTARLESAEGTEWLQKYFMTLNQQKGQNDCTKYFMITLHKRMLPDPVGIKPATPSSLVGCAADLATKAWFMKEQEITVQPVLSKHPRDNPNVPA